MCSLDRWHTPVTSVVRGGGRKIRRSGPARAIQSPVSKRNKEKECMWATLSSLGIPYRTLNNLWPPQSMRSSNKEWREGLQLEQTLPTAGGEGSSSV